MAKRAFRPPIAIREDLQASGIIDAARAACEQKANTVCPVHHRGD